MKPENWAGTFICLVMFLPLLFTPSFGEVSAQTAPDIYFGVDMAFGHGLDSESVAANVAEAKALIDNVCNFTNFFIVGTSGISSTKSLNETLQYAYDKGMYFMSFIPTSFSDLPINISPYFNFEAHKIQWLTNDKLAWGDKLVGFLAPPQDEPGGRQIDQYAGRLVQITNDDTSLDYASNYTEAVPKFEDGIRGMLSTQAGDINQTMLPLFTSDYALYWFDYKGGYDGVFAQIGLNQDSQLAMALCRGAAQVLGKQWGVIVTYPGNDSSNFESGPQLYSDMMSAYNNGAKYIVIFDSNENYTEGILQQEHLQAMQDFWNYILAHPRSNAPASSRTALVLPYGYALAFRSPYDSLWGIWPQDVFPLNVSAVVQNALATYGDNLDIVYDEDLQASSTLAYNQLVYWNDTALAPKPSPSPTPTPTATPSLTPTHTPPTNAPSTLYIVAVAAVAVAAGFIGIALAFRKVQNQNNSV